MRPSAACRHGRWVAAGVCLALAIGVAAAQTPKRLYIANDDHTDYMWTADEATYRSVFIEMIDYYLNQADATAGNASPYQGRFNPDGTFWIWEYEKNKSAADVSRLIGRIKDGHFSVPLNPLVLTYGGMPAEAVLRAMYYGGQLERRFNFRIPLAVAMEDQTFPYGLAGLWAGAGAKYSWKGVCGCASKLPNSTLGNRDHEIYWLTGPDGSRILMKWNSLVSFDAMGGYGEARNPWTIVDYMDSDPGFLARYPYRVAGAFGKGHDDLKTLTGDFITAAQDQTNASRQVYVSNQIDFFQDFQATYGGSLPSSGSSFGNEWELYSASMSELSGRVKRSLEKLRAAEAMATLVTLKNASFMDGREAARDKAMIDFGLYFEHDWTADGPVSRSARRDWQRKIAGEIESYVDTLHADAKSALGAMIVKSGTASRFFVFNPASWARTGVADFPFAGAEPIHVVDLNDGSEAPSQIVTVDGERRVRIFASNVPSVGYKVFEIRTGAGATLPNAATVTGGNVMENALLRITVSDRGAITSWIDKTRGNRELALARGGFYLNDLGTGTGTLQVENAGPVSVTLVATASSPLTHTTRVTLVKDSPRIEIENRITQNFGGVQTWRFSFDVPAPDVRHEEVGAVLRARLTTDGGNYATRNARYDWLTINHFADVTGSDGVGVTLSNADLYFMQLGNSSTTSLDTATPLFKVLAGGQVDGSSLGIPNQGGDASFLQRFAMQSHGAFDPVAAMKLSLDHQNPFVTGAVTGGSAYAEKSFSFLTVSDSGTLLWALKPADDGIGRGVAVRLWNLASGPATATVRLVNDTITSGERTSHVETFEEPATIQSGALQASLAGQQLRTFVVKPAGSPPPPPPPSPPPAPTAVRRSDTKR